MNPGTRHAWRKGERGEWYVAGQAILFILIILGPRQVLGWPPLGLHLERSSLPLGGGLVLLGALLFLAAIIQLGPNLTALPYPVENLTLVQTGPYALMRHPVYCAVVLVALGWAVIVDSWLTLAYAVALLVLLDFKARREERWLVALLPDYVEYQRRVRRFVPFIC